MSLNLNRVIPVVPLYHPTPPINDAERQSLHTHIKSSLESVGKMWLAVHEMPEQAYPSLPRIIPGQLAAGDMDVEQPCQPVHHTDGHATQSPRPDQPSTPKLVPPPDGMLRHPSPMRLAPFIVDQHARVAPDEVFTPTPTKSTFAASHLAPDLQPHGVKARKESSTLGLMIDETHDIATEDVDKVIQTAKHGSPSRAHMVRLSPHSPRQMQDDLLDSPDSPASKQKLPTPLLPKIKVQFGDVPTEDQPKSPFEAFSPLISAPPRDAAVEERHDDDVSMRRTNHGGTTDKSGVGPGMTPSLAEIMDRVGVTAQRNRLEVHD